MNKPAAIAANLVDVRNVAAHKSVRLEIHVPAEQAGLVLEAFGWPTAVSPVPVAIARLDPEKTASEPPPKAVNEPKERRRFEELPLPQQAGICCEEPMFWRFLGEEVEFWRLAGPGPGLAQPKNAEEAAEIVRIHCDVKTRSDIRGDKVSGNRWLNLRDRYHAWKIVG